MKKTILAIITLALFATGCKKTCETGYTGSSCTTEKTPTSMTITKIEVNRFEPRNSSGFTWDVTSAAGYADIFIDLKLGSQIVWQSPVYYASAYYLNTYTFTPTSPITISNPTSDYTLSMYDFDGASANDFMNSYTTNIYRKGENFPSKIILTNSINNYSYTLYVTYNF